MRTLSLAVVTMVAVAGSAGAQHTVRLEPKDLEAGMYQCHTYLRLGPDGKGSRAFPTKSGSLIVQRVKNVLRIDTNGDGAVDEADAPGVRAMSDDTIPVEVRLGDRTITYAFTVSHMDDGYVSLGAKTALVGETPKARIALLDTNMDGVFTTAGSDGVLISRKGARQSAFAQPRRLARVMAYGSKLYWFDVRDDGFEIVLRAYDGPVSKVSLEPRNDAVRADLTLEHVDGLMSAEAGKTGSVTVAAGRYRITRAYMMWQLKAKPKPKGLWSALTGGGDAPYLSLGGSFSSDDAPVVELAPGDVTLTPGPPYKLGFIAQAWRCTKSFYSISCVYLTGSAGERYDARTDTGEVWHALRSGEREISSGKMEFG
jgi:hypothetical protein